MKLLVFLMMSIALLAEAARAQQAQPSAGTLLAGPKTGRLPTPSGTPEPQSRPDLLPESTALPAEPPDLRLPSPSGPLGTNATQTEHVVNRLPAEEEQKNRVRLSAIRVRASYNARVIELLHEANGALTDEARREFMRAYYHTLCNQMRKLEPGLARAIGAYERVQIRQLALGPSRIGIASREQPHRPRHARHPEL
jgi:hypothetical protein